MTLVRFDKVSLEFGDTPLLKEADFAMEPGERVCLIGRNGAGKSSMLKLITGELQPDHGDVQYRQSIEISQLKQDLPNSSDRLVREVVTDGLAHHCKLIEAFHERANSTLDKNGMRELEVLQRQIETHGGWHIEQRVDTIITELNLPATKRMHELSGGWRRRVLLGQALVAKPDLLLLDEPTNHLDISTIQWLENQVRGYAGAVLFITHDRAFLQKIATRIVELDRGQLTSWPGDYRNYLDLKEKALEEEERQNALFDKKLAQEEAWIRQGIKARRTRNEGRVRALEAMRAQRAKRIKVEGKARMHMEEAEQSGRKVIQAYNVGHGYGDETLIKDFSVKIMRGDRIGIIGNNGVGKSTLLRILLGEMKPDQGTVKLGTNLEIAYFDQLRNQLELDKTVIDNVGQGREFISLGGKERHVISYLKDFLFTPKRAMTPVKVLSGGERNRVILAKLFTNPSNLLVLDEPTNDLDVEMLEVLEQRLVDYEGTLLLVSHDRDFIDNVVTSVLVFEGDGKIQDYVGGYSDWAKRGKTLAQTEDPDGQGSNAESDSASSPENAARKTKKLSYKFQRELDQLPGQIEGLETEVKALEAEIAAPDFYSRDQDHVQAKLKTLSDKQETLDGLLERWMELEAMQE